MSNFTWRFSTSILSISIFCVSSTTTFVSLMTGGASSIAFFAFSRSLRSRALVSSTLLCISCNEFCSFAISCAFDSSRLVCTWFQRFTLGFPIERIIGNLPGSAFYPSFNGLKYVFGSHNISEFLFCSLIFLFHSSLCKKMFHLVFVVLF